MDELYEQIRDVLGQLATARLTDWEDVDTSLDSLADALSSGDRTGQRKHLGILAEVSGSRRVSGLNQELDAPESPPAGHGTLEVINRIVDLLGPAEDEPTLR